ncbi:hypothetical protein C7D72_29910, partial [Klebsiella pneumoniae]
APAPPGCWRAWRSYSGFQPWPAGGRQIWCVSTTSGRFYYGCAGAAGLLAGLAIVFWFPALASWWPSDLVRVYH